MITKCDRLHGKDGKAPEQSRNLRQGGMDSRAKMGHLRSAAG